MECTALAEMVITFKDQHNIIFHEIKLLSSEPVLIRSKISTENYKAAFTFQL